MKVEEHPKHAPSTPVSRSQPFWESKTLRPLAFRPYWFDALPSEGVFDLGAAALRWDVDKATALARLKQFQDAGWVEWCYEYHGLDRRMYRVRVNLVQGLDQNDQQKVEEAA